MATNTLHNPAAAIARLAKKWHGPALERPLWSIIDWPEHFENSHTRKLARLPFVLLPTKHDGKGFRRIMRNEKKAVVFACWVLIAQLAAKSAARGYLADEDGPYTTEDMADMTGMNAEDFELSIAVLTSPEINWMRESSPDNIRLSPDNLPTSPESKQDSSDLHDTGECPDNLPTSRENVGASKEREEKVREEKDTPIVPKGDNADAVTSLTEKAEKKEGGGLVKPAALAAEAALRIRTLFGANRDIGTIAFGSLIEHVSHGVIPADEKKWAALAAMRKARLDAGADTPKDLRYDWLINMEKLAEKLPIAFDIALARYGSSADTSTAGSRGSMTTPPADDWRARAVKRWPHAEIPAVWTELPEHIRQQLLA
jgi:hypothetical protein